MITFSKSPFSKKICNFLVSLVNKFHQFLDLRLRKKENKEKQRPGETEKNAREDQEGARRQKSTILKNNAKAKQRKKEAGRNGKKHPGRPGRRRETKINNFHKQIKIKQINFFLFAKKVLIKQKF